ncbi:bifunctional acetate--CoA ligase family protein/GNAT family N-acetyltransferase [Coralliovum pocilloporae]|uniref:bifunctional acetate--CoA ligase family protein/GNAT family N-acetyltransferase n=1 Tax=Coralliovum pocilloporae TaxID=3066369 RepID=UPI0033078BF7
MSTYNLDAFFQPNRVAVIGASDKAGSIGGIVYHNICEHFPHDRVYAVNPRLKEIDGRHVYGSVDALPAQADLAVIATPPHTIPDLITQLGYKGTRAAVIITAGLGHGPGSIAEDVNRRARSFGLRIAGPNCVGLLAPHAGLNASFAHRAAPKGDLAILSQSGAIVTTLVDWMHEHDVGCSALVSLGDQLDADFGDFIDYFATSPHVRAILLYVEAITDARKFMSAARAASRVKPVVVIKSGRHDEAAKAASSHTGALAGSDAVYDAVFRRAGLIRAIDLDELFDAAETLAHLKPFKGRRLSILTNGGGAGVLAVDRLMDFNGSLSSLSDETMERLNSILPETWSHANPVDIIGDAGPDRYVNALNTLLADKETDAVLVINCPTALCPSDEVARDVAEAVKDARKHYRNKPVLANWMGDHSGVMDVFADAHIPLYKTPAQAVRGFMDLVAYSDGLDRLMRTPPAATEDHVPDREKARKAIQAALDDKRSWLQATEVYDVLSAYGLPITQTCLVRTADEARVKARQLLADHGSVVAKIASPDIVHKSDMGGVVLDLDTEEDVAGAFTDILERARNHAPSARIEGVTLHPMIRRRNAVELIAGLADDATFGPVVVFGRGGTAVEVINDKALALPPLDANLARDLIAQTRVSRVLRGYRNHPAANQEALAEMLVRLGQLAADMPEIRELDLNPVLANADGVIAVDGRIAVAPAKRDRDGRNPRMIIRPFPDEWRRDIRLKDGRPVHIRPIKPEDEHLYSDFFEHVSREDIRLRFFSAVRDLSHSFIARLTQIDYARAMAFVALDPDSGDLLGVVRMHGDANHDSGEYAVLVRSDLKGQGLGWKLMRMIITFAKADGYREIIGEVLRENTTMLSMCRHLGFEARRDPDDRDIMLVKLDLTDLNPIDMELPLSEAPSE